MIVRVHRPSLLGLALAIVVLAAPAAAAPTYVDLQVIDVTPQVSGRDVSWKVTVQNAGTAKSKKFLVEVFPHSAAAPGPDSRGYPAEWMEGLFSGETREMTLGPVPRANGAFTSWVLVDGLDLVPEAEEGNNLFGPVPSSVQVAAGAKPEIFVSNMTLTWGADGKLNYVVAVHNGGAATATPFRTNLRYDAPDRANPIYVLKGGETGQNWDHAAGLGSGETKTITFSWPAVPDGLHTSWVYADVPWDDKGDAIDEEDEDNNLLGPILVARNLVPDEDSPDLAVTDLRATVAESTVTYEVDVQNLGLAPVGSFEVLVVLDSPAAPDLLGPTPPVTRSATVTGIAPGEEATATIVWDGLGEGTYLSWAFADPFNVIAEDLESNNSKGPVSVTILPPEPVEGVDLAIEDFTVVAAGSEIGYAVTVRNMGSSAAGPFDVDVVLDVTETPALGTRGDKFQSFTELAPGASVKALFVFDGVVPGGYVSWAIVDTLAQVSETDESNNIAGPKAFTIEPSIKSCTDGAAVAQPCRCGANVVQSGWCCDGELSPSACPSNQADAGATDAGGDIAIFDPLPEEESGGDDSGCSTGGGSPAPWLLLLALVLGVVRRARVA